MGSEETYAAYCQALGAAPLPAALVDLDAVDANVDRLVAPVRAANKTLRVATKSVRSVGLLRHLMARAPDVMRGLMCYAAREAGFLFERGFDDLLIAYPTVHAADLDLVARLNRSGGTVRLAVDDRGQVDALARRARLAEAEVPVVIDVDLSLRALGGAVHLGVRRSPIRDAETAIALAKHIGRTDGVRFAGLLAYEAQIAGVGDDNPFTRLTNPAKRAVRRIARGPVARTRAGLRTRFEEAGLGRPLFNGGGTGSLRWACEEAALTEVTVGSGFLDSHLFDYYRGLELEPAAFFALQIVRRPGPGFVTCHGGGYVASGEPGPDRLPRPWLPEGLSLVGVEGAGEVQTPLRVAAGIELGIGAPVFFRHAKAGELAEHFDAYHLVRGKARVGEALTYRGEGGTFS